MAEKKLSLHDINDRGMSAMHRAAWEGDVDLINRLLRDNPRMSFHRDIYGRVPLVCAAENDQTEAVRALVHYTTIKMADKNGRTALHWSVQNGNEKIVALLLPKDFSPHTLNGFQNTISTRRELPPSAKSPGLDYAWVNSQTTFGDTALHLAAARCDSTRILVLLVRACNVTLENFEGKTALQMAFLRGQEFSAKGILREMVMLNVTGSFESIALEIVKRWPDDRDESWNRCILCWAASNGFKTLVTFILKTRKYLFEGYPCIGGRTALQAAAEHDHLEIAKLLLAHGANANISSSTDGRTAIQAAAEQNHFEMVKLLLSYGADVNASAGSIGGLTAVQAAAGQGHLEMVKLLVSYGAEINASPGSTNGLTALQAATERSHFEIVKLLLSYGAEHK
jgi:ankyrin repeat protein